MDTGIPTTHPCVIRDTAAGDLGWILMRHGEVYSRDHGWGLAFEALVARVIADFAESHDPKREHCWIGEIDGARAGSIMLVRVDDSTAKLRLLLVEPIARGRGLGRALVRTCLSFAAAAGYSQVVLFTCSTLLSARKIYEAEGFQLVREFVDPVFKEGELAQEWSVKLR